MIYRFNAYGHPNILGTHKTTLEFTKDKEISLNGDCIAGVDADFDLVKLKKFIKKCGNSKIKIIIQKKLKNNKNKEIINAELNPNFYSYREVVIRKTNFISERTFAINADKAACEIQRDLIGFLKKKGSKVNILIAPTK